MQQTLYLIDGPAIFYRAHFAFVRNPLITSRGEHTSAVFGFTNTIWHLMRVRQPDYCAIAFDSAAPTFRHQEYKEYKAHRAEMPSELIAQLPYIDQVVEAFNIPALRLEGFEADDLMGTLARQAAEAGLHVYLVTSDKDMAQLVNDQISMYVPPRRNDDPKILDAEGVYQKYGVHPHQMIDYLALMGDSSDNVPGVPGVGEKTATRLLAEYGDLETVLANAENVKRKNVRENLQTYVDQARLSQKLVTIDTHVPIEMDLDHLKLGNWNSQKLIGLFSHLEFRTLLKELETAQTDQSDLFAKPTLQSDTNLQLDFNDQKQSTYHTIDTDDAFLKLIADLENVTEFAIDTETTSQYPVQAELVGISIAFEVHQGYYIPLAHTTGTNLSTEWVLSKLIPLLENENITKIFQNFKYDWIVLHRAGVSAIRNIWDTMIAAYLIDPGGEHNLDFLAQYYLDITTTKIAELIGTGKNQKNFADVTIEMAAPYAAEDADITFQLKQHLQPKLTALQLNEVFENIELQLTEVLAEIEMNGIKIDPDILKNISVELDRQLEGLAKDIYELAGEEFNINSTLQLREILFDKLEMPVKKKTPKGVPSTDMNVLEELSLDYELPRKILEYRGFTKLKSTYVDALPTYINSETDRIHTSLIQTGTTTGRLASRDPNLQNIPIRSDRGKEVRTAFVARDADHVLVSADYSQIELRVMAHLSADPKLVAAFREDRDIHTHTAALIFDIPPEDVTSDLRRQAKIVNFGVMYGMGAFRLARDMGISRSRAKAFIDDYFKTYTGIKVYIDRVIADARREGYVLTLSGRRRPIQFNVRNKREQTAAENMAINTPIQGSAADIIKVAMIKIHNFIQQNHFQTKMTLQVHDELLFDVPRNELDDVKPEIKRLMESAIMLNVPLKVEIGVGDNWLEAH